MAAAKVSSRPFPTPHGDKLRELAVNDKLPAEDRKTLEEVVLARYAKWLTEMAALESVGDERIRDLTTLLNDYKHSLELDFIWDSEHSFLYRQRGQLKLDSSVLEEFLPRLADERIVPALEGHECFAGPRTSFSAAYFACTLSDEGPGLMIRTKDQDFTIGRLAYLAASLKPDFSAAETAISEAFLAFVAAECKTNLDKTMFQEAIATAHDLKAAIAGARYYLVCEWLDMTPISTVGTDINKVLILRGKRLASNVRKEFADPARRQARRSWYVQFLAENPVRPERLKLLAEEIQDTFAPRTESEDSVLARGYF